MKLTYVLSVIFNQKPDVLVDLERVMKDTLDDPQINLQLKYTLGKVTIKAEPGDIDKVITTLKSKMYETFPNIKEIMLESESTSRGFAD